MLAILIIYHNSLYLIIISCTKYFLDVEIFTLCKYIHTANMDSKYNRWIETGFSNKTTFSYHLHIGYAFCQTVNNNLPVALVKLHTSGVNLLFCSSDDAVVKKMLYI